MFDWLQSAAHREEVQSGSGFEPIVKAIQCPLQLTEVLLLFFILASIFRLFRSNCFHKGEVAKVETIQIQNILEA